MKTLTKNSIEDITYQFLNGINVVLFDITESWSNQTGVLAVSPNLIKKTQTGEYLAALYLDDVSGEYEWWVLDYKKVSEKIDQVSEHSVWDSLLLYLKKDRFSMDLIYTLFYDDKDVEFIDMGLFKTQFKSSYLKKAMNNDVDVYVPKLMNFDGYSLTTDNPDFYIPGLTPSNSNSGIYYWTANPEGSQINKFIDTISKEADERFLKSNILNHMTIQNLATNGMSDLIKIPLKTKNLVFEGFFTRKGVSERFEKREDGLVDFLTFSDVLSSDLNGYDAREDEKYLFHNGDYIGFVFKGREMYYPYILRINRSVGESTVYANNMPYLHHKNIVELKGIDIIVCMSTRVISKIKDILNHNYSGLSTDDFFIKHQDKLGDIIKVIPCEIEGDSVYMNGIANRELMFDVNHPSFETIFGYMGDKMFMIDHVSMDIRKQFNIPPGGTIWGDK